MKYADQKIVKSIADDLDCGYDCYFNPKTSETISIPAVDEFLFESELGDVFSEELTKINAKDTEFLQVEKMSSSDAFVVMEHFLDEVKDAHLKLQLENALQGRKPFANYKHRVEGSDYREAWFKFKQEAQEYWVERYLKVLLN